MNKMSKDIAKQNKEMQEKFNALQDESGETFEIGDIFIDESNYIYKVVNILPKGIAFATLHEYTDGSRKFDEYKFNPKYPDSCVREWGDIKRKDFIKCRLNLNETLEDFEQRILQEGIKPVEEVEQKVSDETALMRFDKTYLVNIKAGLEEKRKKFELMERMLHRKRNELSNYVHGLMEQIKK